MSTDATSALTETLRRNETLWRYAPLAVGLCLALLPVERAWLLVFPELPSALAGLAGTSAEEGYGLANITGFLADATLLLLLVRYWERLQWGSVGVRMISARDLFIALALWFIDLRTKTFFARMHWFAPPPPPLGSAPLVLSRKLGFAYILAAVVVEELGSRAYIIERFMTLTGSVWIAGAISMLASIMLHVPAWGVEGALARAPALLVFVLLYLWRRNLPLCLLTHLLFDVHLYTLIFLLKLPDPIRSWLLYVTGITSSP